MAHAGSEDNLLNNVHIGFHENSSILPIETVTILERNTNYFRDIYGPFPDETITDAVDRMFYLLGFSEQDMYKLFNICPCNLHCISSDHPQCTSPNILTCIPPKVSVEISTHTLSGGEISDMNLASVQKQKPLSIEIKQDEKLNAPDIPFDLNFTPRTENSYESARQDVTPSTIRGNTNFKNATISDGEISDLKPTSIQKPLSIEIEQDEKLNAPNTSLDFNISPTTETSYESVKQDVTPLTVRESENFKNVTVSDLNPSSVQNQKPLSIEIEQDEKLNAPDTSLDLKFIPTTETLYKSVKQDVTSSKIQDKLFKNVTVSEIQHGTDDLLVTISENSIQRKSFPLCDKIRKTPSTSFVNKLSRKKSAKIKVSQNKDENLRDINLVKEKLEEKYNPKQEKPEKSSEKYYCRICYPIIPKAWSVNKSKIGKKKKKESGEAPKKISVTYALARVTTYDNNYQSYEITHLKKDMSYRFDPQKCPLAFVLQPNGLTVCFQWLEDTKNKTK